MPKKDQDPRTYIKCQPLPIPDQKGIKIQARSSTVFNPTLPTRSEVRIDNYNRRLIQLTQQGYQSVNYKPYQNIGGDIHLNDKKLILTALDQWTESEDETSSSSDDESDDSDLATQSKPMTPAKFVLRRTRKDLNTLNKQVSQGRNLIRNVKLGHGLFQTLRHQQEARMYAAERESQKKAQEALNQWQPPKYDSSEEEDEEDLELQEEVDLTSYMSSGSPESPGIFPTQPPSTSFSRSRSRVSFAGDQRIKSAATSTKTGASKKKQAPPRPYTPVHSNINTNYAESTTTHMVSKDALFRQLCALFWLLEAMNLESGHMENITTCWNLITIGGAKVSAKKEKEIKEIDNDYQKWLAHKGIGKAGKKMTRTNTRTHRTSSTLLTPSKLHRAHSSTGSSPRGSQTHLDSTRVSPKLDETIQEREENESSKMEEESEPTGHSKSTGFFSFLDDYYESFRKEREREEAANNPDSQTDDGQSSLTTEKKKKKHKKRASDGEKSPRKAKRSEHMSVDESRLDDDTNRSMRSSVHLIRPKSSPALIQFQANLPSNKKAVLPTELKQKFAEIKEEKALDLHDKLEHIERQRLKMCQNKFFAIPFERNSVHHALRDMRKKLRDKEERRQEKNKQKPLHCQWYAELVVMMSNMPEEIQENWHFKNIIDKLEKFGKIDSIKQSAYRFIKTLSGLREWEICNPDVSAAVEFCREKIVDMSVEDYEEWFQQQFPRVMRPLRPQTAPPVMRK